VKVPLCVFGYWRCEKAVRRYGQSSKRAKSGSGVGQMLDCARQVGIEKQTFQSFGTVCTSQSL
jgi:hypothetical protein